MRFLARLVASIAAPFILLFGGAALAGLGAEWQQPWLLYTGLVLAGCGLLLLLFWWLAHG